VAVIVVVTVLLARSETYSSAAASYPPFSTRAWCAYMERA
jgi:hypothetical protein